MGALFVWFVPCNSRWEFDEKKPGVRCREIGSLYRKEKPGVHTTSTRTSTASRKSKRVPRVEIPVCWAKASSIPSFDACFVLVLYTQLIGLFYQTAYVLLAWKHGWIATPWFVMNIPWPPKLMSDFVWTLIAARTLRTYLLRPDAIHYFNYLNPMCYEGIPNNLIFLNN